MNFSNDNNKISGRLIDIHHREAYPALVTIKDDRIEKVERTESCHEQYILPGLIDAHIHIESSMVTPGAFALAAVRHGTTAVVSDPHEIANVLGIEGVKFMIGDAAKSPMKFYFGAPSCVPATSFETSGAGINSSGIKELMVRPDIRYLSEMMNFPGVIYNDNEVHEKIKIAHQYGKKIDGHAPGLSGEMLKKYVSAGITTDHECSTLEEALEKISLGMKIIIREGSAARNLNSLKDLFRSNPSDVMLCSDDLHPEMLRERHINKLISSLVNDGYDVFDVVRSATVNPVKHYGLECGLLREGDYADLIIVDNPNNMNIYETWINGKKVFGEGKTLFQNMRAPALNKFVCSPLVPESIRVTKQPGNVRVIEAMEGELITGEYLWQTESSEIRPDISKDILKIVVKDRYNDAPPVAGFIKGFGLKKGAFASSVAHDSHNIICIGTNDGDIINAINAIVKIKGGLSAASGEQIKTLRLDIAGIMSTGSVEEVASSYQELSKMVVSFGTHMKAPFMTLSFMALLVIPELKIGDKGLFSVKEFRLVPLFA